MEKKRRSNPYLKFLDSIKDENIESFDLSKPPSMIKLPWLPVDKIQEDPISRKAEERIDRIASRYCAWVRQLPGAAHNGLTVNEEQIKDLFSHTIKSSTSSSKLSAGLRSWVRFGMFNAAKSEAGSGAERKELKQMLKEVKNAGNISSSKHRQLYGAWYLPPDCWNKRYKQQVEIFSGRSRRDSFDALLCASLPGQVDMMGQTLPVSQLQSTKAFKKYLENNVEYKQPEFIRHIFKSTDSND